MKVPSFHSAALWVVCLCAVYMLRSVSIRLSSADVARPLMLMDVGQIATVVVVYVRPSYMLEVVILERVGHITLLDSSTHISPRLLLLKRKTTNQPYSKPQPKLDYYNSV